MNKNQVVWIPGLGFLTKNQLIQNDFGKFPKKSSDCLISMVYIPCILYLYRSILQHTNILENMKSPTPQLDTCVLMERGWGYLFPQKFQWKPNQYFQNPGKMEKKVPVVQKRY